jgi:hypothetical protein
LGKTLPENPIEWFNFIVIKKSAPRASEAEQNIEFSHVNGPKDQAGGCLADLLFVLQN